MGKKNLDKLFQEKLKDFSEVPEDKVWHSIEASLDKKEKSRKVIPIWWKLGGVAAVLLIAVTLINPFEGTTEEGNNPVVTDTNIDDQKASEEDKTDEIFQNQNEKEHQIVDVEKEATSTTNEATTNQVTTNTNATENSAVGTVKQSSQQERLQNQNTVGNQFVNSDNTGRTKNLEQNLNVASKRNFDKVNMETEVVDSKVTKTELEKNTPSDGRSIENNRLLNEIESSSEEGIAKNKKDEEALEEIEGVKKKSIFDEIAKQEQEDEAIAENTGSKWSAGPSIAPVYYDAMGEGSPVHSIFVPNSKSGDVNLSYGLSVAYEVSKKLSIRSGVHKVDYGYRTNDVEFSSSLESATNSQIDNIDYSLTSRNLVVTSKVNTRIESLNQNPFLDTSSDVSAASASRDGVMEQQFGYLEVPVELNYALVDNRFGINLIGGVSSLFLVDNSISLSSGELTTEMGEANNVNAVNFSTNVGFGMNYKVTPKVQINIEPVFKYQLNTFSETDGTFNPFSVGVYSGLSFKF